MRITQEKFLKAIHHARRKIGVRYWANEFYFTMSNEDPERPVAVHFLVFHKRLLGTTGAIIGDTLTRENYIHVDVTISLAESDVVQLLKPNQITADATGRKWPKNAKALRIICFRAMSGAIRPYRRDNPGWQQPPASNISLG